MSTVWFTGFLNTSAPQSASQLASFQHVSAQPARSQHAGLQHSLWPACIHPICFLVRSWWPDRPQFQAQVGSPADFSSWFPVASRVDSCSWSPFGDLAHLCYWSPVCSPGNTCCWSIVGNQFLYFNGPQFLCCIIIQWQPPVSMSPQTSLLASSSPALLPASSSDHPSASSPAFLPPDCSPELMSPASRVVQPTTPATRSSSGGTPYVQSSSYPSSSCSALLVIPLPSNQEAGLKDATG